METSKKYVVAVVLLAVLAVALGVFGTIAPPLGEEGSPVQPQQESSSESVGHFQNPPTYDSGWVNMTAKTGQYVTLKHSLNTIEVAVDVTGRQSLQPMGGGFVWNRTYGSPGDEEAYSTVLMNDGGCALAGMIYSINYRSWLVRTDSAGNMLWNKTLYDFAIWSMSKTADEGCIIVGTSAFVPGCSLIKTDSAGNTQWLRTYELGGDGNGYFVVQTQDGGYATGGKALGPPSEAWLIKTDSEGNMIWNKTYKGAGHSLGIVVVETSDGGYALAGTTHIPADGFNDIWLIKTDSAGTALWNETYGGTNDEHIDSIIQTSDGGYAMGGSTESYGAGGEDIWLIKTDSSGNMVWNKTFGGTEGDWTGIVIQTDDYGYILAGFTHSFGAASGDLWLIKTDSHGSMKWNQTFGTPTASEWIGSIAQTSDGGFIMGGGVDPGPAGNEDFLLVKAKSEMQMDHQINYGYYESGLAWTRLTNTTITVYRGKTDVHWNYVRVRIWVIKEPSWIYGDINMDGIVDGKDLYIIGRNYGQAFSLLSLGGIIALAGIRTVKKRKQTKQPSA